MIRETLARSWCAGVLLAGLLCGLAVPPAFTREFANSRYDADPDNKQNVSKIAGSVTRVYRQPDGKIKQEVPGASAILVSSGRMILLNRHQITLPESLIPFSNELRFYPDQRNRPGSFATIRLDASLVREYCGERRPADQQDPAEDYCWVELDKDVTNDKAMDATYAVFAPYTPADMSKIERDEMPRNLTLIGTGAVGQINVPGPTIQNPNMKVIRTGCGARSKGANAAGYGSHVLFHDCAEGPGDSGAAAVASVVDPNSKRTHFEMKFLNRGDARANGARGAEKYDPKIAYNVGLIFNFGAKERHDKLIFRILEKFPAKP